jgi:cellobiose phosphorylase
MLQMRIMAKIFSVMIKKNWHAEDSMKYGYFDEATREYVITRPDTPAPWANYLGSPEYGAILSNNAGGYSFVRSGANGRILRYRFNAGDKPGRYVYLRDRESGDYWSVSWQPVGKPLDQFQSECRHGLSYSVISSQYSDIRAETLYYVPLGKTYEVWRVRVKNTGTRERSLSAVGFAEFTTDSNYEQDGVNLQYTQFITRTYFKNGQMIFQTRNENCGRRPDGSNGLERFFALAGAPVSSYCGDRDEFLGRYHTYGNPVALERGDCGGILNYNGNPCGALQTDFSLQPDESLEFCFLLGAHSESEAKRIADAYCGLGRVEQDWNELKTYWRGKLHNLRVDTPDENFNCMVNTWNAYQCFITFVWSRAASFVYCGLRNGYGYRDTVQDIQGILHLAPEMALGKIRLMVSGQVSSGAGLPLIPYNYRPGHVKLPGEQGYQYDPYRADDALWLFPTIWKYICETGNTSFLDEVIPFADKGEATVYEHLKRAVRFSRMHSGAHGMPAGLSADWNDCLRMGEKGESSFVAFQLYYGMRILKQFAGWEKEDNFAKELSREAAELKETIFRNCWQGDRFIRGIREDGAKVGSKGDPEADFWLNPQSWAVISGCADGAQGRAVLDETEQRLNTEYGAMLLDPPYRDHAFEGARMLLFNASTKENGGIFSQAQGWLILAESLLGHGDRAFRYYRECSPAEMNDRAEIRGIEPYAHGQFTEGSRSPNFGRSHVHWLTGTASTVMVGCVEGILGIRPVLDGIVICPSVPSTWKKFTMRKIFRGAVLNIVVRNPEGAQGGRAEIELNGRDLRGNFIPANELRPSNDIVVTMLK